MSIIKRTSAKDFNPAGLGEELLAAGLPLEGLGFDGFDRITRRHVTPAAAPKVVGRDGGTPTDTANPGEIRLHASRALTPGEDAALDTALDLHDRTTLTARQASQDQDTADIEGLLSTDRQEFIAALARLQTVIDGWDAATTAQRMAATKASLADIRASLLTLGKVMRFVLRQESNAAI